MNEKEFWIILEQLTKCGAKHHLDYRMLTDENKRKFWEWFNELNIEKGGAHGNSVEQ